MLRRAVSQVRTISSGLVKTKSTRKTYATLTSSGNDGPNVTIQEMFAAGLHFGHSSSKWNPRMAPYLYCSQDKEHIFDLEKTSVHLTRAQTFVANLAKDGGKVCNASEDENSFVFIRFLVRVYCKFADLVKQILFVSTRQDIAPIVREAARFCGQPHVTERWMGGALTNWKQTVDAVYRLADLDKERNVRHDSRWNRDYRRIWRSVNGLSTLSGRPDALFVADIAINAVAVREANKMRIPVIALIDSNDDPSLVNYPIPGNNDSAQSVHLVCRALATAAQNAMSPL